eukprot:4620050-Pyramimonas_sp.AAC.1
MPSSAGEQVDTASPRPVPGLSSPTVLFNAPCASCCPQVSTICSSARPWRLSSSATATSSATPARTPGTGRASRRATGVAKPWRRGRMPLLQCKVLGRPASQPQPRPRPRAPSRPAPREVGSRGHPGPSPVAAGARATAWTKTTT